MRILHRPSPEHVSAKFGPQFIAGYHRCASRASAASLDAPMTPQPRATPSKPRLPSLCAEPLGAQPPTPGDRVQPRVAHERVSPHPRQLVRASGQHDRQPHGRRRRRDRGCLRHGRGAVAIARRLEEVGAGWGSWWLCHPTPCLTGIGQMWDGSDHLRPECGQV